MKHLILIIAVLTGSAPAFAQPQQPGNCLEFKKVKIAHLLHQHGQTQAEITLKVKNCEIVEDRRQTSATFESKPGLEVTFGGVHFRRPKDEGEGESAPRVKEVSVWLTLAAAPDFPVGETTVHGMLTYQAVRNGAAATPETLSLSVPLKVAPLTPDKPVKEHNGLVKGLEAVAIIVAAIPIVVFMMIYCPISGQCPDC
jgi:hypothetical protein